MYQRSQYKNQRRGRGRSFEIEEEDQEVKSQRPRNQRHPSNLKGKEIGLFYARKQRERRQEEEEMSKDMLDIPDDQVAKINQLLSKIPHNAFRNPGGQSDFLAAYNRNLSLNAVSTSNQNSNTVGLEMEKTLPTSMPKEFSTNKKESPVSNLSQFRRTLPAFSMRNELVRLVEENNVVVVSGETGCGKTTQVPQYIYEEFESARIVCTQPRRISAITVASRVAEEMGESLGKSVGYQIRLESVIPTGRNGSSILFCTTGIVLQWMIKNPQIRHVTHLIVDEIHERDIQSDFILCLLKDLLRIRKDLKVILMSATMNANSFSKYFFGCPILTIPGFTFPVKEYFLEDVLEMTGYNLANDLPPMKQAQKVWYKYTKKGKNEAHQKDEYSGMIAPFLRDLRSRGQYSRSTLDVLEHPKCEDLNHNLVAALVFTIHAEKPLDGAILCFLPGWEDISKVNNLLTDAKSRFCLRKANVLPLHSLMPTAAQREIFDKPPSNTRKIVLSTNIAETSVTIDDIVYVIDTGKVKMTNFDVKANIATFKPEWISLANSKQRKGRAGRVRPGIAYHLFTKAREMCLDSYILPEIMRKRLEEIILQIKAIGLGKAQPFLDKLMDPPSAEAIILSLDLLRGLGAISKTGDEQLTHLGFHLSHLPMDPQTGKMILFGAIFSCLDPVLSVAASLSFKDAFVMPLGKEEMVDSVKAKFQGDSRSDHLMMANVIAKWEERLQQGRSSYFCYDNFLSESVLKMLQRHKRQFAAHLHEMNFVRSSNPKDPGANRNSDNEALVRAVICAGLYPNVAKAIKIMDKGGKRVVLRTHQENHVELHPKSANNQFTNLEDFRFQWFVFHLKMKSGKVLLYDTSMISPLSLAFFGENLNQGMETIRGLQINLIKVDRMIKFNCDADTSNLITRLRQMFHEFLAFRVSQPRYTDWESTESSNYLLQAIILLLTFEVKVHLSEPLPENEDNY